jgi:hypothetical protein
MRCHEDLGISLLARSKIILKTDRNDIAAVSVKLPQRQPHLTSVFNLIGGKLRNAVTVARTGGIDGLFNALFRLI